jgi:hypothetical protein
VSGVGGGCVVGVVGGAGGEAPARHWDVQQHPIFSLVRVADAQEVWEGGQLLRGHAPDHLLDPAGPHCAMLYGCRWWVWSGRSGHCAMYYIKHSFRARTHGRASRDEASNLGRAPQLRLRLGTRQGEGAALWARLQPASIASAALTMNIYIVLCARLEKAAAWPGARWSSKNRSATQWELSRCAPGTRHNTAAGESTSSRASINHAGMALRAGALLES